MKITGRQRIAVEAGSALLVLGGIVGGIVAFSGGPKPPAEGSPEWVQALDVKTKRSADLGRDFVGSYGFRHGFREVDRAAVRR
ncbi:hypothetical protein ACFV4P_02630 [Kitasatospora sp. NPDC059795]|uniref:hypothetical protein n=1 Tax=Kitasatospora sp. NPDC059795 TaxID=3346949 RepID=UPI003651C80F